MRIALFTDTYVPQVNGVARTLQRLVSHAAARGHEVALIAPGMPEDDENVALRLGLASVAAPFYPELRLALPLDPWGARRLSAFRPHVVHVATEFTVGWSGITWAAGAGLPLVSSFHTDFPAYLAGYGFAGLERQAWRWLRNVHERARITLCPSGATLAQLRGQGFRQPLRVWSRGVDAGLFDPARRSDDVRARLAPGASTILLYVGRLAPEKRVDVLLEAFAAIRQNRPDVALVVVGDGPAAPALQQAAPEGTTFTGCLSGVALAEVYASADIFAFPSDTETFGNVVLEALAAGLPAVAPAQWGVLESVHPDRTGLLFPPRDAAGLRGALLRLIDDEALRQRLAAGARSFALRKSWCGILDGVLETYAEAASDAEQARVA